MLKKALQVVEMDDPSPTNTTVAPAATVEGVTDAALGVLKLGLDAIHDELQLIINGQAPESKYDKASRIAHLTSKVGPIADSIRKLEAARAKRLELTPAAVLAWLRSCDARSRRLVLSEFEGLSNGGSVLG